MGITIAPTIAQLELNTAMTLNVSGGTTPYTLSASVLTVNGTSPVTGTCPVTVIPSSGTGTNYTITGQCFGVATVTVTDSSQSKASVQISVGSVVIASPDGNYYRCYPSGATVLDAGSAQPVFDILGSSNVFGDATATAPGSNKTIDINIVSVAAAEPESPKQSGTDSSSVTAVTCYLLNLAAKP